MKHNILGAAQDGLATHFVPLSSFNVLSLVVAGVSEFHLLSVRCSRREDE